MLDQGIVYWIKVVCARSRYSVLDQGILSRMKVVCAG